MAKRNNVYSVHFLLDGAWSKEQAVSVLAACKTEAYDKATYETIPEKFGHMPWSAWVSSVTYQNGNEHSFNTSSGNPY